MFPYFQLLDNKQIAAGEAKNPRKNLPKVMPIQQLTIDNPLSKGSLQAIKRVYIRILIFYIGGTLIIGLLVPSNSSDLNLASGNAAASPFVIAIKNAGIKGLPSVSPLDMRVTICSATDYSFLPGHQCCAFDFCVVCSFQ